MELWAAFTIALVGALTVTLACYPLIVWLVCKYGPR